MRRDALIHAALVKRKITTSLVFKQSASVGFGRFYRQNRLQGMSLTSLRPLRIGVERSNNLAQIGLASVCEQSVSGVARVILIRPPAPPALAFAGPWHCGG